MIKLFLDFEWADVRATQLVSLALVTEDGKDRFYAEVNPLPTDPTDFVRFVVYPLLEHGYCSMQKVELTRALRAFLARFDDPLVLYDHPSDGKLFCHALRGFGESLEGSPRINQTLVSRDDIALLIEQYFRERPDASARRHHAGVDVEALRWACMTGLSNPALASKPVFGPHERP